MNIILAPDSFKGTLSSREVCGIMADELTAACPGSRITSIPVADGGEGTVDCFVTALGGEVVRLRVSGPYFEPVDSFYGIVTDAAGRRTAIVEMAAAAGLPMAEASGGSDPCRTTTYGVGELILDARCCVQRRGWMRIRPGRRQYRACGRHRYVGAGARA